MSSNNQLIIIRNKDGEFEIHENLCVDNEFNPDEESLVKIESYLEDAIKFANEYSEGDGFTVEYGTYIHPSCYAIGRESE